MVGPAAALRAAVRDSAGDQRLSFLRGRLCHAADGASLNQLDAIVFEGGASAAAAQPPLQPIAPETPARPSVAAGAIKLPGSAPQQKSPLPQKPLRGKSPQPTPIRAAHKAALPGARSGGPAAEQKPLSGQAAAALVSLAGPSDALNGSRPAAASVLRQPDGANGVKGASVEREKLNGSGGEGVKGSRGEVLNGAGSSHMPEAAASVAAAAREGLEEGISISGSGSKVGTGLGSEKEAKRSAKIKDSLRAANVKKLQAASPFERTFTPGFGQMLSERFNGVVKQLKSFTRTRSGRPVGSVVRQAEL